MEKLPKKIENLIMEYAQSPIINCFSNKIKELGGLILTKHYYRLYQLDSITESNKTLYFHAKNHYSVSNRNHLIKYDKKYPLKIDGSSSR